MYLNCGERYEDMIDHRSYMHRTQVIVKLKPENNSGLNGIRTRDLCEIAQLV